MTAARSVVLPKTASGRCSTMSKETGDFLWCSEFFDAKDWERIFGQCESVEFLDDTKTYGKDKNGNEVTGRQIKDSFERRYDKIDWSK